MPTLLKLFIVTNQGTNLAEAGGLRSGEVQQWYREQAQIPQTAVNLPESVNAATTALMQLSGETTVFKTSAENGT